MPKPWEVAEQPQQPSKASKPWEVDDDTFAASTATKGNPTQYGFSVKPTTIDLGRGPAETVQREDGAVWVDRSKGWDPSYAGGEGWKFQSNGQWVPAPDKPVSKMGWAERNVGPEAWKAMGRNLMAGFTRPGEAVAELGQRAGASLGVVSPESRAAQAQEQARREAYRKGVGETSGVGSGLSQIAGEAVPYIAAQALTRGMLPATSTFGQGAVANALAAAPATYAMTPGSATERATATGIAVPASIAGEYAMRGIGNLAGRVLPGRKPGAMMEGPPTTPEPAMAGAVDDIAAPAAQALGPVNVAPEVVGATAKKASGKGMGSAAARARLAEMAALNPEAKAAADRLGIELPADVFSDSPQVRAAAGLTRSVAGSEPEAAWRTMVGNAVDKADETIQRFDAMFLDGTVSPGGMSQKVRESLVGTRNDLSKSLSAGYHEIDNAIPKAAPVELNKLGETLSQIVNEVGEGGLTSQEKRLAAMLQMKGDATYGRLMREKNLIGQAIAGKASPYGDMETASLKRLYAALSEDQLENVGRIGGEEMRSNLHGLNLLYGKQKGLEKRIVSAFGDEFNGSIAQKMVSAIAGGAKGGTKEFEALLKVVPKELQKETIATSLAAATRSMRGAERGGFGFSEFAKMYQGLRANPQVHSKVMEALGPESAQVLGDLYTVSQRITEARANVLTTGKANQALVSSIAAETIMEKLLDSTMAKGAATTAAAFGGGPLAAGATSTLANALSGGKREPLRAVGNLFNSEEFKRLAVEAATKPRVSDKYITMTAASPKFSQYADKIGLPKKFNARVAWLNALVKSAYDEQTEE